MDKVIPFGYWGRGMDALLALMGDDPTIRLIDIRLSPKSRFMPDFHKSRLQAQFGERYLHVSALGNLNYRPEDRHKGIELADPGRGLDQLIPLLARGYTLILMCACKDEGCHRWVVLDLIKQALARPYIIQMDGFEVVYLTPISNVLAGALECAPYAVSLSGGLGSAIAGERAVQRYGRENVSFWFSDVWKEDEDLYRFLWDLMLRWGGRLYYFFPGKRPEDIWTEHGIIGNNRMCPCSYELKVFWFREFVKAMSSLPVIYIGYKVDEEKRIQRTTASYQKAIPEATVDYPLLWDKAETRDLATVCLNELGIIPPRAYRLGYDYNNCGGSCCRSGIGGRCLTAIYNPKRYQTDMEWEEMMRAKGGSLEGRAFCSRVVDGKKVPLPLREILEIYVPQVRAYIEAHPHLQISEKTIIKDAAKWQRKQAPLGQINLWEGIGV